MDICNQCQEPISENSCVIAGDKKYHEEHFTCSLCSISLSGQPFYPEQDGSLNYCKNCYITQIASKCAKCGNGIIDDIVQLDEGVFLHQECFICTKCSKQLSQGYTKDDDDRVICFECQEDLAQKCSSCGLAIMDVKITALGQTFHKQCFKCNICNEAIDEDAFDEVDGQTVHRKCLKMTCGYCNQGIIEDSEYYRHKDIYYHSGCVELAKQQMSKELQLSQEVDQNQKEEFVVQNKSNPQQEEDEKIVVQNMSNPQQVEDQNNANQQNDDGEAILKQQKEVEELRQKLEQEKLNNIQQKQIIEDQNLSRIQEHNQILEDERVKLQKRKEEEIKLLEIEKERAQQHLKVKQQAEEAEEAEKKRQLEEQEKIKQQNLIDAQKLKDEQQKAQKLKDEQQKVKEEEQKQQSKETNLSSDQPVIAYSVYSYDILVNAPPSDVILAQKEAYLSEEEFSKIFSMKRTEFLTLKAWRQKELKQKYKLF